MQSPYEQRPRTSGQLAITLRCPDTSPMPSSLPNPICALLNSGCFLLFQLSVSQKEHGQGKYTSLQPCWRRGANPFTGIICWYYQSPVEVTRVNLTYLNHFFHCWKTGIKKKPRAYFGSAVGKIPLFFAASIKAVLLFDSIKCSRTRCNKGAESPWERKLLIGTTQSRTAL